jgi:hypothetical protein
MVLQPVYGIGPHLLLWAGLWARRGKITVSRIPNHLNYCLSFIVFTLFTNVAADWRPMLYDIDWGLWNQSGNSDERMSVISLGC